MKGEINIVETNFKIYYSKEKFVDTINASSIIFNSLFKQYKMDYNILVDYFNIPTWYTFLKTVLKIGFTESILQQNSINLLWLFCIYPIILSLSYLLGNKL